MGKALRHYSTNRAEEQFVKLPVGKDFDVLARRAEDIGMRINQAKTQLLVISPFNGCNTTATFNTEGGTTITSVPTMRLVGFTFGDVPDAGAHVEAVAEQYKKKKWMLYHLRDSGFKGQQLFRLYCCYIRSAFEYCSVVYHSVANRGQEQQLERLQRHALCVCFGYVEPIENIMAEESISTLKERRTDRCDRFLNKVSTNPRFGPVWLRERGGVDWNLRNRRRVQEVGAVINRRFNYSACLPAQEGQRVGDHLRPGHLMSTSDRDSNLVLSERQSRVL